MCGSGYALPARVDNCPGYPPSLWEGLGEGLPGESLQTLSPALSQREREQDARLRGVAPDIEWTLPVGHSRHRTSGGVAGTRLSATPRRTTLDEDKKTNPTRCRAEYYGCNRRKLCANFQRSTTSAALPSEARLSYTTHR